MARVTPTRADALDAFGAEDPAAVANHLPNPPGEPSGAVWQPAAAIVLASFAIVGLVAATNRWLRLPPPTTGRLTVATEPAGVTVLVDEREAGNAPVTLTVPAGNHTVVLRRGAEERTLSVTVGAGADVAQYLEWPAAASPAPAASGRIVVTTEPAGGRVQVDRRRYGSAPITIDDVAPGDHIVSVTTDSGTTDRKVTVAAGQTASVIFAKPGPSAGWLTVSAPFDVLVYEGPDLVASGGVRAVIPAGLHELTLVNRVLGYQEQRRITVNPGRVASLAIEAPRTILSVTARPSADVFIDGSNVGQTPLTNLTVAIGTHQIVFRHPQLGEQRQTVTVTIDGPNRVSADFNR